MKNDLTTSDSSDEPKRGRPPVVTLESVTLAVEELRSQNLPVGIRSVMRLVGGGQDTIKALLKLVPSVKLSIGGAPELPESLARVWKSCVKEHIKDVMAECDKILDAEIVLRKTMEGRILDCEIREMELTDLVKTTSTERDRARAERDAESEAHAKTRVVSELHCRRSETARANEILTQHKLEEMCHCAQAAEVRAVELERRLNELQQLLAQSNVDNALLKGQLDAFLQRGGFEGPQGTSPLGGEGLSAVSVHRVGTPP